MMNQTHECKEKKLAKIIKKKNQQQQNTNKQTKKY